MVKIIESFLTDEDIVFYTELIDSDNVEYNPIYTRTYTHNFYNRFFVNNSEIRKSITEKLISNKLLNDDLLVSEIWINKITPDSNKNDGFHFDENDISIIIYLNDEFIGGEFEYIDDSKSHTLHPKKGLTLRLDNRVEHRVLPVTYGIRYSLVIFIKKKKTLL